MVEFNAEWYKKFVTTSNEKNLLVNKISELTEGKRKNSCLEIGLGISPYFANILAKSFKRYVIIERERYSGKIPKEIEFINSDWENIALDEKFDVIVASHVVYYFQDKKAALDKAFDALSKGGSLYIVVNGAESDYGPLKFAFSEMIGKKYYFTYDEIKECIKNRSFKEYTLPSVIKFDNYEELFETLRLSFDAYPTEYENLKDQVINYFKKSIKGNNFIIDQKIFEITK